MCALGTLPCRAAHSSLHTLVTLAAFAAPGASPADASSLLPSGRLGRLRAIAGTVTAAGVGVVGLAIARAIAVALAVGGTASNSAATAGDMC